MGNNQSKISTVPNLLLATSSRTVQLEAMSPRRVSVASLHFSTTTSETAIRQSLRDRQCKRWLLQLLEKGRPTGFTPNIAFVVNSAEMVTQMGNLFFPDMDKSTLEDLIPGNVALSIEACAATIMWLLEETSKNPWTTLWLFLNARCHKVWPHLEIRGLRIGNLLSLEKMDVLVNLIVKELADRMADTQANQYCLVCTGCGRMVEENERFSKCECKQVSYCSKECQLLSWPQHSLECTAVQKEA